MHDSKLHMLRGQLRLNRLTKIHRKRLCIRSARSRRNIHIGQKKKKKKVQTQFLRIITDQKEMGKKNNKMKLCVSLCIKKFHVCYLQRGKSQEKKKFALSRICLKPKFTREALSETKSFAKLTVLYFFYASSLTCLSTLLS